jgi:hypothetical protein
MIKLSEVLNQIDQAEDIKELMKIQWVLGIVSEAIQQKREQLIVNNINNNIKVEV